MGLLKTLKSKVTSISEIAPSAPAAPIGREPTDRSIYQSRQNFGVNFGSLFLLEKYIFDEMFVDDAGVELDAIKNCFKKDGVDKTRERLEHHWKNYCSDSDWEWLKEKGIQSIRIPFGYWLVDGGSFTKGTSFESLAGAYAKGWSILKKFYIEKAKQYQISILVDLHALPKGANTGDHSGEWFKDPDFWNDSNAINLAVEICAFIAKDLADYDNICGIQIVNESVFSNNPSGQEKYYRKAANAIRKVNSDVPIIISDGWWPDQWVNFLDRFSNGDVGSLGIVIDDHIYRCFSDDDKNKKIEEIIEDLDSSVLTGLSKPADFIIGEYSCVLDSRSWDRSQGCNRDDMVRAYGNKQCKLFKERANTGHYFWTFKFQHGDGGEWGLVPMISRGCIPSRNSSVILPSKEDFDRNLKEMLQGHENYWKAQNPNENYEFWRYKEGFTTGWHDALSFARFNNSRIGRMVAWTSSRRKEHVNARKSSPFLWQWEAGFQEAIRKFEEVSNKAFI